ncbi:MAG TPA: hypothetical protein VN739_10895 [Nitrososphaerales archaeon]|nr:hypothetical protein [Nitrososphaerales archaeon]
MSRQLSSSEREKLLEDISNKWEETLHFIGDGGDVTFAFLGLAKHDLLVSGNTVDCQYCKRHIGEEAKLIDMTMDLAKLGNTYPHAHGLGEKMRIAFSAMKITVFITLGGLRRAGFLP